ncbi:surface protease GP63, putative, partial [Trypanosoma cruzi marinkellei]
MQFTQAMRQPRHATPPLPLVVLLLMYCASGCIAADPALAHRRGLDAMMGRSGPLPTAVVREVPRKGQGAMQAYTVATPDDDDSAWRPIRIEVFTEELKSTKTRKETFCKEAGKTCDNVFGERVECEAGHLFSDEKKELYNTKILPGAVKLHAERLLVKPTGNKVEVPSNMGSPCHMFTVPNEHRSGGVLGADFIIYAAAGPSSTERTAVRGVTCITLGDSRPSIGAMNFDPKYMTDTAWSVRVAAHEIAHALGFSQEKLDENRIEISEKLVRGRERRMVAGKHVKAKAQAHFDCNSLEGMELEDEDDALARKVPHWKERHARDELMA